MTTTPDLRAYHNDKAIKAKYVARVAAHKKADNLIRGSGWDGHRGCAIGCTLQNYDHARYPIELGIPVVLARLEDHMFERMPIKKAMLWPGEFLRAIPVGADLSDVWPKFAIWLLRGVRKHADADGKAAIDRVITLYRERVPGDDSRWANAANAADAAANAANAAAYAADAANTAAYAAAYAAANTAAYAAAYAAANAAYAAADAADAAANAANAAAYAADAADANTAAYRQSRKLLELLRAAPVRRVRP